MTTQVTRALRPRREDYLRALGYFNFLVWSIVFFFVPPDIFLNELTAGSLALWMLITAIGSVLAMCGVLTRVDLKLELPGVLLMLVGPIFYTLSQVYLTVFPVAAEVGSTNRVALIIYALLGVTLLLPHTFALVAAKNRLKNKEKT